MNLIIKRLALNYQNKYIWPDSFNNKNVNKKDNKSDTKVSLDKEGIYSGEAWKKLQTWFRNAIIQMNYFAEKIGSGDPLFVNLDELGLPEPEKNESDFENQKLWSRYLAKRVLTEEMKDAFDVSNVKMKKDTKTKSYSTNYKGIKGVGAWFGRLVEIYPDGRIINVTKNKKQPTTRQGCICLCVFNQDDLNVLKEAVDYFKRLMTAVEKICNFYDAHRDTEFVKDESVLNFLKSILEKVYNYNVEKNSFPKRGLEEAEKVYKFWELLYQDNFLEKLEELERKLESLKVDNPDFLTNEEVEKKRIEKEYVEWLNLYQQGDKNAVKFTDEQVRENLMLGRSWNGK